MSQSYLSKEHVIKIYIKLIIYRKYSRILKLYGIKELTKILVIKWMKCYSKERKEQ